jgi:hypothetical protein
VMKHSTVAIALTSFQRDPSFSTRVSTGSSVLRALIGLFDQPGVGRTVGLFAKLLGSQCET